MHRRGGRNLKLIEESVARGSEEMTAAFASRRYSRRSRRLISVQLPKDQEEGFLRYIWRGKPIAWRRKEKI